MKPLARMHLSLGLIASFFSVSLFTAPSARGASPKPNIVIILIDDMGYGDVGCYNPQCKNRTPNVDRMAKEGMKLTSFYAAPVCTPSRSQILTGCYAKRVSLPNVIFPAEKIGLSAEEHTIAGLLKQQGYATMAIGKWHVGDQVEFLPTRRGFDHYLGLPYSNDMGGEWDGAPDFPKGKRRYPPLPLVRDEQVIETLRGAQQDKIVQVYTDEAVKFIREHQAGPFFLYLPHTAVHVPIHPGTAFQGKSNNGRYGDWVEEVNASTGRVLDTIRELKLEQNTIVLFTSDNGPWLIQHSDGGVAGPLRGGKGGTYEGGMREPTIAWWPGHIAPASANDAVAGEIDLLPTFVKLAGGTVPSDRKIDGADIMPLMLGQSHESPREAHYYFDGNQLQAIRSGPWKLAIAFQREQNGHGSPTTAPAGPFKPVLYNLDTDIGERKDVSAEHPDIVKRLQDLVATMDADLGIKGTGPGVRPPGRVDHPLPLLLKKSATQPAAVMPAEAPKIAAPNIVYILCDDLGYGDVHALNPQRGKIATPNLDKLAAEGMVFTDAHSGSSVCTPTRYGIMTGRYSWRTSLQSGVLSGISPPLIAPDRMTVASLLKQHGYVTACMGKWHLGLTFDSKTFAGPITDGPINHGFDSYFGISASLDMPPFAYIENDHFTEAITTKKKWVREGPAAEHFEAIDVLPTLVNRARQYIADRALATKDGHPFFLYLALTSPHTPLVPTAEWKGKSGLGDYGDFVMETDWAAGQVLEAIESAKIIGNTLVILTSDNGCAPYIGVAKLEAQGHYPSADFRGYKSDIWDGGHRIPFIARWPGRVQSGSHSDQIICLTDLLATCADLVKEKLPDNAGEDSVSLLPALLGQDKGPLREAVVHHSMNGMFAIRQGNWKLELCPGSGGWSDPKDPAAVKKEMPQVQLYDMTADVGEKDNLQSANPAKIHQMLTLLRKYVADGRSTPGIAQKNDAAIDIWKRDKIGEKRPAIDPVGD